MKQLPNIHLLAVERQRLDQIRDRLLQIQGFKVLRFIGSQVTQDLARVSKTIENAIDLRLQRDRSPPHPQPLVSV